MGTVWAVVGAVVVFSTVVLVLKGRHDLNRMAEQDRADREAYGEDIGDLSRTDGGGWAAAAAADEAMALAKAEVLALVRAEERRMRLQRAGRAWCEETLDAVRAGRLPFTAPPRPAWHLLYPSPPVQPDPDHETPPVVVLGDRAGPGRRPSPYPSPRPRRVK